MAAMTNASLMTQPGSPQRQSHPIELDITMMDTRSGDDGSREFHFWGKLADGRQGRAHFTVPGELGRDILFAVEQQLQRAYAISAHGRWTSRNVSPGKNVWTFRIEVIDSIRTRATAH